MIPQNDDTSRLEHHEIEYDEGDIDQRKENPVIDLMALAKPAKVKGTIVSPSSAAACQLKLFPRRYRQGFRVCEGRERYCLGRSRYSKRLYRRMGDS